MSGGGNDIEKEFERLKELIAENERRRRQAEADRATRTTRVRVNKRTHRIRFDSETEDSVDVVIEPKEAGQQ